MSSSRTATVTNPASIRRFANNPLITAADIPPSAEGIRVECVFNPGAFRYGNRIGLLLRVAEKPIPEKGWVSTLVLDEEEPGKMQVLKVSLDDPDLRCMGEDARGFDYKGRGYLTTVSHLRLAWSTDAAATGTRNGSEREPHRSAPMPGGLRSTTARTLTAATALAHC